MTALPVQKLGRSGLTVSALGFGVTGPHATGFVPRSATLKLVRAAIEAGVTLFDTAPFYGDGVAEKRLGEAIKGLDRNSLQLCTKAGTVVSPGGKLVKDFTPVGMRARLERSLSRLGVDQVDILLLHGPAPAELDPPLLSALERFKSEGLARAIGVCGRGAELDAALDAGVFDVLMAPVRIDMAPRALERIARARDAGVGVLGIETLAPSQSRLRFPRRPSDLWYAARGAVRGGGPHDGDRRDPAACLHWALNEGGADAAVTTTTRLAHLRTNVAALERTVA